MTIKEFLDFVAENGIDTALPILFFKMGGLGVEIIAIEDFIGMSEINDNQLVLRNGGEVDYDTFDSISIQNLIDFVNSNKIDASVTTLVIGSEFLFNGEKDMITSNKFVDFHIFTNGVIFTESQNDMEWLLNRISEEN